METDASITLERIEGFIRGFWWILPNLGIALMVFLIFLGLAWGARAGVSRFFNRRGRPDLAALLAGFARWSIVALGLLVVATIVFPSVKPADVLATLGVGSIAIGFAFKDILRFCRNSFFPTAGLWPALVRKGEAACSRAGNSIDQ